MSKPSSLINVVSRSAVSTALFLTLGCGEKTPPVTEFSEVYITAPAKPPAHTHGSNELPPGHPPLNAELPDGHPPLNTELPDGHPPVNTELPDGHPPIDQRQAGDTLAPPPANSTLAWETPEGWDEVPASGMRLATFHIDGEEGKAEGSLIVLGGTAGGIGPNINRWIKQLGLPPLGSEDMNAFIDASEKIRTAGGAEGILVDLTTLGADEGEASATSMMVGLVQRGNQTIFIKLNGARALLQAHRAKLLSLSQSLK